MKVFWSWQNDIDPDRHRWFIKTALEGAVDQLAADYSVDPAERPELDHDTKDEAGMVEIANAILTKIKECAAFVADVTPIGKSAAGKALPNPNVLIELGWALKMPGWQRLIAVMNIADGYSPDDLPFDIRHRRALTYSLPEGTSTSEKKAIQKRLTAALVEAIRKNVQQHLEAVASEYPLTGREARAQDRSIWKSDSDVIEYSDALGLRGRSKFTIPKGPRAYARLIPSGWKNGSPRVTEIQALPIHDSVQPSSFGVRDGDFGFCEYGYFMCWYTDTRDKDALQAGNVAMYFDDLGEYWAIDSTATFERKNGTRSLALTGMLVGWALFLRRATSIMDNFGAYPLRRFECGIVGLDNTFWPTQFDLNTPAARKKQVYFESKQRDWSAAAQTSLLRNAYDEVRDAFGISKAPNGEIERILRDI